MAEWIARLARRAGQKAQRKLVTILRHLQLGTLLRESIRGRSRTTVHASVRRVSHSPAALAARINQILTGLDRVLGLKILTASAERVEAELEIGDHHRQVHGVVHGGVYATMVETLGSVGAFVAQGSDRIAVVGMENHTSFLRAVRSGKLRAFAVPLNRGRRTQLWEVRIETEDGRLAASGRLRTLCLEDGAILAGADAAPLGVFEQDAQASQDAEEDHEG